MKKKVVNTVVALMLCAALLIGCGQKIGGILWLQRGHFCVVLASIHSRSLSFGTTMRLPIFSAGKPSL